MRGSCAQLRGASAASDCATGGGPVKPSWPARPRVPRIVRHVSMDAFLGERIGGACIDAGGAPVAGPQRGPSSPVVTSAELTALYLARLQQLNPDPPPGLAPTPPAP